MTFTIMTGWTPLFQQIVTSSIWEAPDHVRVVWITMLAIARKDGIVPVTPQRLAKVGNVTLDHAHDAIKILSSPDSETLSQDNEGRRIERVDGGWKILNWDKFRNMAKSAAAQESNREAQAKFRQNQKLQEQQPLMDGGLDGLAGRTEQYHKDSRTVLHLLNEASGRDFREVDSNLKFISARLNEPGVNLDGVRLMISRQCRMWNGTTMAPYLRPETLFGKEKFDSYYSAREMPIETKSNNPNPGYGPVITTDADVEARIIREMKRETERALNFDPTKP